jgi:hypothetical protein
MGFNPFRRQDRSIVDIAIMVVTLLVVAGLVAWAALSG